MKREQIDLPNRPVRVSINGFGRIGRLVARSIVERPQSGLRLVGINELADARTMAWLLERDSIHGRLALSVSAHESSIAVGSMRVRVTSEPDPACLLHGANRVDIVMECSGRFASRNGAERHLKAGAGRVLIAGPASDADLTIVYGINDDRLTDEHRIVSNASCTTNCLALVAKVLNDEFGIERGLSRTVHGYTSDQQLLDGYQSDLRRARSATISMVPVATRSPEAVCTVLPELSGRLSGSSVRVPAPNVSLIELIFESARAASREGVNSALRRASETPRLKTILDFTDLPLVSSDLNHTSASATVDGLETRVSDRKLVRVLSWYDNEWAYAQRMVDTASAMARTSLIAGHHPRRGPFA
ncbi:MAG TPA: type I glyceraldehyde-3-phosphate dehydrogenase [Sphingomicrobium sp.]|nr:type I glyceraldehyde-3-phosphate dehydrogenase [Sphingomicrobium sp.]